MKTIKKEVYYCDFCKKHNTSKSAMVRHEKFCSANPDNKHACFNCAHLTKVDEDVEFIYDGQTIATTVQKYKCVKLNKKLHSYMAARKRLLDKYPHQFEGSALMPQICSYLKHLPQPLEADTLLP